MKIGYDLSNPEGDDLVEQHRGPHMRVLEQPGPDIGLERVIVGPSAHTGAAFTGQIHPDGLAVMAEVTGDRGDRPTSLRSA